MPIQLSRANSGTPLTTADYNSDNLIVETAVNSLLDTSGNVGTVTSVSEVDTDTSSELFSANITNATTTPQITFSRINKAANLVYASPNGASGKPTMRALVSGDLPVVPKEKGGTGLSAITANKIIRTNNAGSAIIEGALTAGSTKISINPTNPDFVLDVVPANIELNTLASTTPLEIAKGGTGAANRQAAINALTGSGTNGHVLTLSSGNAAWLATSVGIAILNGLSGNSVTIGADNIAAGTLNKWNATHTGDVIGSELLTIDNNKVTYAKMQAISATKRLLGRVSAGSGNTEEIAIGGNLAMSSTELIVRTSKVITVTADYSVPSTEGTILVNASGRTMTLPQRSDVTEGAEFIITNISGGATTSVIPFNATSERINGATSYTISAAYDSITLKYGGLNSTTGLYHWYIISKVAGA
jgi:hypothetical protein